MRPEELTTRISELVFEKKGSDVKLLNLNGVTAIADYFIICSAESDTQVKAIADHIDKTLRDEGVKLWHREGYTGLNWVLLDYVDVVVHVFKPDSREFYGLEKLWGDSVITEVTDPILNKRKK